MTKYLIVALASLLMACSMQNQQNSGPAPDHLLVEALEQPLNVHKQRPNLSWHANVKSQTHYQIQVASTKQALNKGQADLWDSGKVAAEKSVNIQYQGNPLIGNQAAYWRVKVWSKQGNTESDWSQTATWQTGLINKTDWQAKWIQVSTPTIANLDTSVEQWMSYAANLSDPGLSKSKKETQKRVYQQLADSPTASLFRHDFIAKSKKLVQAKLHSTAAGYYEVFINGQKVDDRIADPGQTDFDKRILYNTDEVSNLIQKGQNTIAIHLGSGWYHEFIAFSKPQKNYYLGYGQPAIIAQLELTYDDGSRQTITTNEKWLSHPSPVLKEGIFSGELYDANKQLKNWHKPNANSEGWQPVATLSQWPTEVLEPQRLAPIKAVKEVRPVAILESEPNVWVFDFGQNFTGIPTLDVAKLGLTKNQAVYLRYAEWIDKFNKISQKSGGGAPLLKQVDGYISNGIDDKKWTPSFTWHGFRYVEIRGLKNKPNLDMITAHLTRSAVPQAGHFKSSDTLLNRIHDMALWGYESNLMALPMDCPIRERAGWTGDAHAALITGNYNFDMENFWQKYLVDFQTAAHVAPAVVPGKRTHGGNFDWAAAEIMIAWEHYRHHGDVQLLANQYQSMQEYMDAGENRLQNNLLRIGYGDWCDPVKIPGTPRVNGRCSPQHTTPTITSSALFAHTADLMAKISVLLNKPEQAQHYQALFKNISRQFNKEFYNKKTDSYGSQTANAMAIRFKIAPAHLRPKIAAALNKDVVENWHGHASVGALGQTYLYRALSDYGYADTAFNIFKADGYPGYRYLFEQLNATTLWERKGHYDPAADPNGTNGPGFSLNHPFHSGYDGWFYEGLGGIRPLENEPAYQHFELKPVFPKDLDWVDVSYATGYGTIRSQWQRVGNSIEWQFEIPANATAMVNIPGKNTQTYSSGQYSVKFTL